MDFGTDAAEDSKNYIRLKDGESVKGVFRGVLHKFKNHWTGERTEACTGDECKLCEAHPDKRPSFRFRLNLIVKDGETYTPKIFENGWKVFQQLRDINSEVPLEGVLVKISRTGSGKNDTSYTVTAMPNGVITPELDAKLKSVPLLDLKAVNKVEETPFEEDIPF